MKGAKPMAADQNRITALIQKSYALVPDGNLVNEQDIKLLEDRLGVSLPMDFKELVGQFNYEYFECMVDFHSLDNGEGSHSVIFETLRLRRDVGFPKDSLFLYEDDASVIVLKTMDDPSLPSPVLWFRVEDFDRYCQGVPLELPHDVFPSFTDFFEFLLKREEEEQQREQQEFKE